MNNRLLLDNQFSLSRWSAIFLLVISFIFPNFFSPVFSSTNVFESDRKEDGKDSTSKESKESENQVDSDDDLDTEDSNANDSERDNSNDEADELIDTGVNTQKWAEFKGTIANSSDPNSEISKSGEFRAVLTQYNGSQTVFARLSGATVGDTGAP
jgi:hypothetical protein